MNAQEKIHKGESGLCPNGNNNTLQWVLTSKYNFSMHLTWSLTLSLQTCPVPDLGCLWIQQQLRKMMGMEVRQKHPQKLEQGQCSHLESWLGFQAWLSLPASDSQTCWILPRSRLCTLELPRKGGQIAAYLSPVNHSKLLGRFLVAFHLWNNLLWLTHLCWNLTTAMHHAKGKANRQDRVKACTLGALCQFEVWSSAAGHTSKEMLILSFQKRKLLSFPRLNHTSEKRRLHPEMHSWHLAQRLKVIFRVLWAFVAYLKHSLNSQRLHPSMTALRFALDEQT